MNSGLKRRQYKAFKKNLSAHSIVLTNDLREFNVCNEFIAVQTGNPERLMGLLLSAHLTDIMNKTQ